LGLKGINMKFALTKDCSDAFADKINQTITRRESEGTAKRTSHNRARCIWIADSIITDAHLQANKNEAITISVNIDGVTGDDETFLDTLVKDVMGDSHPLSSVIDENENQVFLTWRQQGGAEILDESEVVIGFSINTRFYSKDDFFTLYDNAAINPR